MRDEIIKAILSTGPFRKAALRRKLLEFLFSCDRPVTGLEISTGAFELPERLHDEQRVRERCFDLRQRLIDFDLVTNLSLICELPNADQGYQLYFRERKATLASRAFWQPHVDDQSVTAVYAEPIFYFDFQTSGYLRFLDTNPRSNQDAISELESFHGDDLKALYGDALREKLRPGHIFVGIGEMAAIDALSDWFSNRAAINLKKIAYEKIASLRDVSPILIGSARTNDFIRRLLVSTEGQHFRYRLHETKVGSLTIDNPTEKERAEIGKFAPKDEGARLVLERPPTFSAVRERFVMVTRMIKPVGMGSVTMISSETSLAIQQVAVALTDDKQASRIMQKTGWMESGIPTSFEMLFRVGISAGNMNDEASLAELVSFCGYS